MIDIRPAAPDEAGAIALAHVEAAWQAYAPIFGEKARRRDLGATEKRWEAALRGGDIVLVAADRAAIVGFGHVTGGVLKALYLLEAHWRRGLGRRLFCSLAREARARGSEALRFSVVAMNARAIAFYEARGARPVGRSWQSEADGEAWEDLEYEIDIARGAEP
ncbi:MAG: GNAT family N-acetyltransferase [Caulobacteraceae bacterium]